MKRLMRWLKGLFIEEQTVTVTASWVDCYKVGDKVIFGKSRKKGTIVKVKRC